MQIMKAKDIFFVLLLVFFPILIGCGGGAGTDSGGTINLTWESSADPALVGYKVYYGTASRTYDHFIDVGNVTNFKLTRLTQGQTYFIVVTAYTSNNESGYSNEVSGVAI
jgi:hypothetical protein